MERQQTWKAREIFCSLQTFQFLEKFSPKVVQLKMEEYKCKLCGWYTIFEESYNVHQLVSHYEGPKPLNCELCVCKFKKSLDLKKHVASQHEKFQAMKCEKCGYTCTKESYMKDHIASVHENKKSFKCSSCGKDFMKNAALVAHISSVHEKKKSFGCETCAKSFSTKKIYQSMLIYFMKEKTQPKGGRKLIVRKVHKNANFVVSISAQRKIL